MGCHPFASCVWNCLTTDNLPQFVICCAAFTASSQDQNCGLCGRLNAQCPSHDSPLSITLQLAFIFIHIFHLARISNSSTILILTLRFIEQLSCLMYWFSSILVTTGLECSGNRIGRWGVTQVTNSKMLDNPYLPRPPSKQDNPARKARLISFFKDGKLNGEIIVCPTGNGLSRF